MIATILIFLLGVFVALLVAFLFAPILWRKAQSFARRDYEATIPVSANEIRAEFDRVRAEAAMSVRRQEIATKNMNERLIAERAEVGRANVEIAALRRRERELEAQIANFAAEREKLRQTFAAHRDKERVLTDTLDEAKRDGSLNAEELGALAVKFREVSDLAEDQRFELVAAEAKIGRLTETLRSVERASLEKDTLIRLLRAEAGKATEDKPRSALKAGAMPGRSAKPAGMPVPAEEARAPNVAAQGAESLPGLRDILARRSDARELSDSEAAVIRERIAEVASEVIYRTAVKEGEGSPLAPLLRAEAPAGTPATGGGPSLADRVRHLAAGSQGPRGANRAE